MPSSFKIDKPVFTKSLDVVFCQPSNIHCRISLLRRSALFVFFDKLLLSRS
jgi:hypothetical protein